MLVIITSKCEDGKTESQLQIDNRLRFTDNLKDWTLKEEHNNQEIGQEFMAEPVNMCIAV